MSRKITDGSTSWQRHRLRHLPYVQKTCLDCRGQFKPNSGPQKRCDNCRTLRCQQCAKPFIPEVRSAKYCSRECHATSQRGTHPPQLKANPGRKPRTYHLRHRDKHGSAADRDWRTAVFQRDSFTCQRCGQVGGRLEAHHIKPYKAHPRLRHKLSNGLTLCKPCHRQTDTYGWQGYWKTQIAAKRLSQEVLQYA